MQGKCSSLQTKVSIASNVKVEAQRDKVHVVDI